MHAELNTRQVTISGTTSLIGIIGDPVSKVRSTEVVNALLARKGFDSILIPVHVRAHGLRPVMHAFEMRGEFERHCRNDTAQGRRASFS
jgi:shikimate 5-dehydrogenase